ncbi:MAG: HAD hydrolase-like protein [Oscillospiraceae bacterium]
MINCVLFDLDGTLGDPYEGITTCIKYALSCVGIAEEDPEKLKSYIGPPLRDTFALYGFDTEKCEELVMKYRELYLVEGIHKNVAYDGMEEMLRMLKERGCRIGLASCKPEKACETILAEYGVLKYFDTVAGATEDKTLDRKPAIIAEALRRFGISGGELEHVLMVGDRDMDIIGAHENGVVAVGAAYGYGAPGELEAAGADYIANCPLDVVEIAEKA